MRTFFIVGGKDKEIEKRGRGFVKFTGYSWGLVVTRGYSGWNADDADASNADLSGFNYRTCYTRVKICANNTPYK